MSAEHKSPPSTRAHGGLSSAEPLTFKISSELKNIIGRELITDDFIAIYELVKNAYDANAHKVELYFNHVRPTDKKEDKTGKKKTEAERKQEQDEPTEGKIFVKDDGDGMSYDDLLNKWLFVAYSEKKVSEIKTRRIFAGAKGIGRFSCDKLGSKLKLYTKKENENRFHILEMDWDKFEKDPTEEFQAIDVNYYTLKELDLEDEVRTRGFVKGTILEISSLRSAWEAKKLIDLKRHLQRLINPAQVSQEIGFSIHLVAKEFKKDDTGKKDDFERINGLVRNILFERLQIKTTHISCHVNTDKIHTSLVDKGTFIYKITEKNAYSRLHDVGIELFFLNKAAKTAFTKTMGIEPVNYGSVFFYKNGIKINPCGDIGDDWLGLDKRKAQGTRRNLGTRDVVGRIEVNGDQPYFKEVSSRDGGVVKTLELERLKDLFQEKALKRLEKFVVKAIDWDSDKEPKDPEEAKADSFKIVNQLIGSAKDSALQIEFNKNLFEIYAKKQIEKTPELIKNIEALGKYLGSREARADLNLQVRAVRNTFQELQKTQRKLEKEIAEKEQRALFLERVADKSPSREIIQSDHQIALHATTIENHMKWLNERVRKGDTVSKKDLLDIVDVVVFQCKLLLSITKIVTRASFDLIKSQQIKGDLATFIRQYLERVYVPLNERELREEGVKVKVEATKDAEFKYSFDPFKFIVVLDNLITNAIKANARNVNVRIDVLNGKSLELHVIDDGVGIPDKDLNNIFSLGFSTTHGSGIGLHHVKKVLKEYGSITVNNKLSKGVEFIIRVEK